LEAIKAAPPPTKPRMPRSIKHRPGAQHLYRHFDADGTLLYVGISLSTIHRLSEHAQCSHWFWRIARVEITPYATRDAAAKAELIAIQHEHPLYNVTGKKRGFRHGGSTDLPVDRVKAEVDKLMADLRAEVAARKEEA
jgi:hypothetical protein